MKSETMEQLRAKATAFASEHLQACAADIVEWESTGELPYGRLRELADLFSFAGNSARTVAKAEVHRLVLAQYLAQAAEKKPFSANGYAEQQYAVAKQQTSELQEDSQWRFELWFHSKETPFHELTPLGIARSAWTASREALAEQVDEVLQAKVNNYVSPNQADAIPQERTSS